MSSVADGPRGFESAASHDARTCGERELVLRTIAGMRVRTLLFFCKQQLAFEYFRLSYYKETLRFCEGQYRVGGGLERTVQSHRAARSQF
jgi:hypothetical protein